jgi:hypothetical protein
MFDYLSYPRLDPIHQPDGHRLAENQRTLRLYKETFSSFLWTGIECSNPLSPEGERWDQLALSDVYDPEARKKQIGFLVGLNIQNVRLGMPNHKIVESKSWKGFGNILKDFKAAGLKVSLDLQHFGLPDSFRNTENPTESLYLNPKWPDHYIRFAMSTVKRYLNDLDAITLINEPLITNRFSSNLWNEAHPGGYTHPDFNFFFIQRALLLAKAAVSTRERIEHYLHEQPPGEKNRIVFIHNESCEYQPDDADFNQYIRFLVSDLILGHDWLLTGDYRQSDIYQWMHRHYVQAERPAGITTSASDREQHLTAALETLKHQHLAFQQTYGKTMRADTVFGVDYYLACETVKFGFEYQLSKTCIRAYENEVRDGKRRGLTRICIDYWNRYLLPILHTETNNLDHCSDGWGMKQLLELALLEDYGIPILGFTWYSLMDQFNWDDALKGSPQNLRLHPVGLVSLPDYQLRTFARQVLPELQEALNGAG